MPKIHLDPSFEKSYKDFVFGNEARQKKVDKVLRLFKKDPKHPSLNTEKLSHGDVWTIRVDIKNRLFFVWNPRGDTAIFFMVGKHDLYKKVG